MQMEGPRWTGKGKVDMYGTQGRWWTSFPPPGDHQELCRVRRQGQREAETQKVLFCGTSAHYHSAQSVLLTHWNLFSLVFLFAMKTMSLLTYRTDISQGMFFFSFWLHHSRVCIYRNQIAHVPGCCPKAMSTGLPSSSLILTPFGANLIPWMQNIPKLVPGSLSQNIFYRQERVMSRGASQSHGEDRN